MNGERLDCLDFVRARVYSCSHEEAGGGGDPDQVSQQNPGELRFLYCDGWGSGWEGDTPTSHLVQL